MASSDEDLVFFDRLGVEQNEENEAAASQGVLGGLFSRFFRSADVSATLPSTSTTTSNGETLASTEAAESAIGAGADGDELSVSTTTSEPPKKLSGRLASIFRGSESPRSPNMLDERINNRQYWMPDSMGKACFQCEEKFTAFRRRHHCRICGQIFCSKCCNMHLPKPSLGYMGELRLCSYCASMYAHCMQTAEPEGEVSPEFSPSSPNQEPPVTETENGISAVSTGSLMWARSDDPPAPSDALTASTPVVTTTPSLLCVQDLYMAHNGGGLQVVDRPPSEYSNDEAEPAWVRDIDMTGEKDFDSFVSNETGSLSSAPELAVEVNDENKTNGTEEEDKESPSRKSVKSDKALESTDLSAAFEHRALKMLDYLLEREQINPE